MKMSFSELGLYPGETLEHVHLRTNGKGAAGFLWSWYHDIFVTPSAISTDLYYTYS